MFQDVSSEQLRKNLTSNIMINSMATNIKEEEAENENERQVKVVQENSIMYSHKSQNSGNVNNTGQMHANTYKVKTEHKKGLANNGVVQFSIH